MDKYMVKVTVGQVKIYTSMYAEDGDTVLSALLDWFDPLTRYYEGERIVEDFYAEAHRDC